MFDILTVLLWFSAIASGLIGGLSLAFSTFIPRALAGIDRRAGAAAMVAMGTASERSVFAVLFYGATLSCIALVILIAPQWGAQFRAEGPIGWETHGVVMGVLAYVFGVFFTTALSSRTMTKIFSRFQEDAWDEYWQQFLSVWIIYNLMRTFGSLVAMVCFFAALIAR